MRATEPPFYYLVGIPKGGLTKQERDHPLQTHAILKETFPILSPKRWFILTARGW